MSAYGVGTPADPGDNGTLKQADQYHGGPGYPGFLSFHQTYGYDHLKRLTSVTDTGYSRNFAYDAFGNLSVSGASGINASPLTPYSGGGTNPFAANNRLVSGSYDTVGNQTNLGTLHIGCDAESHQTSVQDGSNAAYTYAYDGLGVRVLKTVPN